MTRVLFIADKFTDASRGRHELHPGGAELTDEAAIAACPWWITPLTCDAVARSGIDFLNGFDVIVLANSQTATPALLNRIASTERHVLFEHDLRICRWRGNFPNTRDSRHRSRQSCWCPHLEQRQLFDRACGVIFLTALQERYYRNNPYFACSAARVLGSSLFGPALLDRTRSVSAERRGTCILAARAPIKGHRQALEYCRQQGIAPEPIKNLSPRDVLDVFARCERFVYLPIGPEWAGRVVVEARLLGCEVVANDLVGVAGEPFWQAERGAALEFLSNGPRRFWSLVEELMNGRSVTAARAVSASDRLVDGVGLMLRKLPFRFWPAGPQPGPQPEPRAHAAW